MNTEKYQKALEIRTLLAEGEHNDVKVATLIIATNDDFEGDEQRRWMRDHCMMSNKVVGRVFDKYIHLDVKGRLS